MEAERPENADDVIHSFATITGAAAHEAENYLSAFNWQLESVSRS